MVTLSNHERELVETLEQCVAVAVANVEGVTPADLNQTKLQKLLYLAIKEFDLPVTYSWYLAGSLVESPEVSPGNVEAALDGPLAPPRPSVDRSVDNEEETELDDPDERADVTDDPVPVEESTPDAEAELNRAFEMEAAADEMIDQPGSDSGPPHSESGDEGSTAAPELPSWPDDGPEVPVETCIDFLESQLQKYPLDSTDRFLIQFYHVHAPEPYHDLYENCLHVRSVLRAATDDVRAVVDGRAPDDDLQRHYEEFGRYLSEVHLELRRIDRLQETFDLVVRCTDVLEDALMVLRDLSPDEYRTAHAEALEELQSFYFEWVWKLPALEISADTATGPSAESVVAARAQTLATFDEQLEARLSDTIDELTAAGLVPDYGDYTQPDRDALNESIVDLTGAYIDN